MGLGARGVGRTDVGGGRDAEGGEGRACGGALDKLGGRLGTRTGRGGPRRGEGRGRGEGQIRKGVCGCAGGDMGRDRACPLADAECTGLGEGERAGADRGGGLGVGETLWGAVRAREGGQVILEGGEEAHMKQEKEKDTHKLALAGETPVDVHG